MSKLNPYIRIMHAAKRGVGVQLTAYEAYFMALDASIVEVACRTADGETSDGGGFLVTKAGFVEKEPQP